MSVLIILAGLVLTIVSALAVVGTVALTALGFPGGSQFFVSSVILFALALVLLAAGFGLYRLRRWAWWLAIIALVLVLINNAAWVAQQEVRTGVLLSLGLPLAVLLYMMAVRGSFRRQPAYAR